MLCISNIKLDIYNTNVKLFFINAQNILQVSLYQGRIFYPLS